MPDQSPSAETPAGFWVRLGAFTIDLAILMAPLFIAGIVSAIAVPHIAKSHSRHTALLFLGFVYFMVLVGIPGLYFTLLHSFGGRTVGKMAFNLKLIRTDGTAAGFPRSLLRLFCAFVSLLPLGAGYLMAAFRKDHLSLHDILSGTRVVSTRPFAPVLLIIVLCTLPVGGTFMTGMLAAIAIPRFARMVEMSKEGAMARNLHIFRVETASFYNDQGHWPTDLSKDLVPKYMDRIPETNLSYAHHPKSNVVETYAFLKPDDTVDPTLLKDTGHWLYDPKTGTVVIDCTHEDLRNKKPFYMLGQPGN